MARTQKPIKPTFIRHWRKAHSEKPSLETMVERLGELGVRTSHSSLSRIERAIQPYNQRLLEGIAEVLGCEPADLLNRHPADPEGIWTVWKALSSSRKRELVAIGGALARTDT